MKQLDIVRVFLKRHLMEQFYTSLFNQMDSSDNKDVSLIFLFTIKARIRFNKNEFFLVEIIEIYVYNMIEKW